MVVRGRGGSCARGRSFCRRAALRPAGLAFFPLGFPTASIALTALMSLLGFCFWKPIAPGRAEPSPAEACFWTYHVPDVPAISVGFFSDGWRGKKA